MLHCLTPNYGLAKLREIVAAAIVLQFNDSPFEVTEKCTYSGKQKMFLKYFRNIFLLPRNTNCF